MSTITKRRGTTSRPNANPILAQMRDDDQSDPWGLGMSWGFAVCEILTYLGAEDEIPDAMGYSPSVFGVDLEDTTTSMVLDATTGEGYVPGFEPVTVAELGAAARYLSRYLDWCKIAGLDY